MKRKFINKRKIDSIGGGVRKMNRTIVVVLALLALLIVAGCSNGVNNINEAYGNQVSGEDIEWKCSNTQCAEVLNGQDWANANCIQNGDGIVCPVIVNNQQVLVPIEQINISAVRSCAKFVCTEEVPVRKVLDPYEINVTTQR